MPILFGTSITSVSYNTLTYQITVNGHAFAQNKYVGLSDIQASIAGANIWVSVASIDVWGDTQVLGTFASPLSGAYDIRVSSSDGEVATLSNALVEIVPSTCTAAYSIPVITFVTLVTPSTCTAAYSVSTVNFNTIIIPSTCTSTYSVPTPVESGTLIVSVTLCTSTYTCQLVSIISKCIISPSVCLAIYSTFTSTEIGFSNISVAACSAVYLAPAITIFSKCIISPTTIVSTYSCYSAHIPLIVGVCSAAYSTNSASILTKCIVLVNKCSGTYSINPAMVITFVAATPCTSIYTIYQPTVIAGIEVIIFAVSTSAIYYSFIPRIFSGNPTIVNLDASSMMLYSSPYFQIQAGSIPNFLDTDDMPTQWLRKCDGMNYDSEREMYRDLTTEVYNKHGICMTYYVTTYDTQYDRIWGEDNNRRFSRKFEFMAFYPLQSEEKMWTKFAVQGVDEFSIYISKDHYREACTYGQPKVRGNIGKNTYDIIVPKEGDVVQSMFNNYLYEIANVKEEAMMIHLNKRYVWELVVRPYMDEHISLDADTSASMGTISAFTNTNPDILNISDVVIAADIPVAYVPKSCERASSNPFNGW